MMPCPAAPLAWLLVRLTCAICSAALLLAGCGDAATSGDSATGSIAVQPLWPGDDGEETALSAEDSGVTLLRATLSAPDLSEPLQQDFGFATTEVTIEDVPAGSARVLTLQGLDAEDTVLFQGASGELMVSANSTLDAGQIQLAVAMAPGAPATLTATPGDEQITLEWPDVPLASGYRLYWGEAEGVTVATGTLIDDVTSPYVHTGLSNGEPYYYVLTATNELGESGASPEAGGTPMPPAPGVFVTPTTGLETTEWGESDTFSVRLDLPPNGDVIVDVMSGDTTEVTTSVASLTFTTSDWDIPQTVTLTGVNDIAGDGDIAATITLSVNVVSTTDTTGYVSLSPNDVAVTNLDNEPPTEGTPMAPVSLTAGSLPAEGSVGSGSSYYSVSGLTPDASYLVSTTSSSGDLELYVYSDNGFATEICPTTNNAFDDERPESCIIAAPAGGTIYVEVAVDGAFSPAGATFTVDVVPASTATEGTFDTPLPLDYTNELPHAGIRDSSLGDNYYVISGLTESTTYRLQLTHMTANADLRVFSDPEFISVICSTGVSSIAESCAAATGEGVTSLYVQVFRTSTPVPTLTQVAYQLDVMPQLSDEGTVETPIELTTDTMPYEGMVHTVRSLYRVTGLVPNTSYRIELSDMAGQGALRVYTDSTYVTTACFSDLTANRPANCSVDSNDSGELFFAGVPGTSFSSAGATYTVRVR